MYRIENWSLGSRDHPCTAPEIRSHYLKGSVYGHPNFPEGYEVDTSAIEEIHDGGIVETRSGSMYELGTPNPEYIEWCKEQGCHVPTKEEPIRIIE